MPSFQHHGASLYYEEYGQAFDPHLRARGAAIGDRRLEPAFRADQPDDRIRGHYRVIAMDQRNAAASRARRSPPRTAGTATPPTIIALLDHLRVDKCHLYGQCIGDRSSSTC